MAEIDRIGCVSERQHPAGQRAGDQRLQRNGARDNGKCRDAPGENPQRFRAHRRGQDHGKSSHDKRRGDRRMKPETAQRPSRECNPEHELQHDRVEQDGPGGPGAVADQRGGRDQPEAWCEDADDVGAKRQGGGEKQIEQKFVGQGPADRQHRAKVSGGIDDGQKKIGRGDEVEVEAGSQDEARKQHHADDLCRGQQPVERHDPDHAMPEEGEPRARPVREAARGNHHHKPADDEEDIDTGRTVAPVHAGSRRVDALSPHFERMIEDDKQGGGSSQRLNGKEACGLRGLALGSRKTHGSIASIWPPAAQSRTTSHGGVCHINSSRKANAASPKSDLLEIALIQTGL